jgi:hypothetical protein
MTGYNMITPINCKVSFSGYEILIVFEMLTYLPPGMADHCAGRSMSQNNWVLRRLREIPQIFANTSTTLALALYALRR